MLRKLLNMFKRSAPVESSEAPESLDEAVRLAHKHSWTVYSTVLEGRAICLKCWCGALGTVENPTNREWSKAFFAPSRPYTWKSAHRVTDWSTGNLQ